MRAETTGCNDPVREFLDSAVEAKVEYKRLNRRVEELESRATKMTQTMSGMPGGGGSGMELLWAALADEREKLTQAAEEEFKRYHDVESFISRIEDPVYRIILRLRYLDGLKWIPIQQRLYKDGFYYTERHITRLHGEALNAARRLWRERQDEVRP
jgi:hypothetical protein